MTRPIISTIFFLAIFLSLQAQVKPLQPEIAPIRPPTPSIHAPMPSIKVDGKESGLVCLQRLDVGVTICGTIATTTWTMTFKNKTDRILEGELSFPLAEGISVSRYALDINGRLRDAVPVEKAKGARVFENVERRRVDPGLLEKVEGNGFRSRIYPISAHGVRTVLIGYEEELPWAGQSALRYRLPLAFRQALEEFNIKISIVHSSNKPVFEENPDRELRFDEWKDTWSATGSWKNYPVDKSVVIQVAKTTGAGEAMMQQAGNHYFYVVSHFPQQKQIEKKAPAHITILWDASLRGLFRDTKKELALLDAYFGRIRNVAVNVVVFSNTIRRTHSFSVQDGRWALLKDFLDTTVYDGAPQFGILKLRNYPCDEYLLFSDGHATFGNDEWEAGESPVYAIVSTPRADFPRLRNMTQRSGGELINLDRLEMAEAIRSLSFQNLYFLGVRSEEGLEESYPSLPTAVVNSISVSGISYEPVQDLFLKFGYGGRVVSETRVRLDFSKQATQQVDLSRIWAEKKIAELDNGYESNKEEIERLGRRYGIVTRNTSLIVLENINDYVNYEIEPPAELRAEYDRIVKEHTDSDKQRRHAAIDDAEKYFDELLGWWKKDYKRPATHPDNSGALPTGHHVDSVIRSVQYSTVTVDDKEITAVPPPPRAVPMTTNALEGKVAGLDINKSAQSNVPSSLGTVSAGNRLDEVVVVAVGANRKRGNTLEKMSGEEGDTTQAPMGDGVFNAFPADVQTEYLDRLRKDHTADPYQLYLDERKKYLMTPLFYLNTATFFFQRGEEGIAFQILSNIAELDVEDYELYKLFGYKLREWGGKQWGGAAAACTVFKKILDWRPFEPQSYRDYALALEDAGHDQQALDTLYAALVHNYDEESRDRFGGIEEVIVPEINNIIARKGGTVNFSRIPRRILTNMPVDIRVVLNWNMNDTDIDLWVTDPDNEKCYYSHKETSIGGRISSDFTEGLGPEQFMLKKAIRGKYKVEVNYYGDRQVKIAGPTSIMVEVYMNYGTARQTRKIMTMQMLPDTQGTVFVGEFTFR